MDACPAGPASSRRLCIGSATVGGVCPGSMLTAQGRHPQAAPKPSPKRKTIELKTWLEEFDLHLRVANAPLLAQELIEPKLSDLPIPFRINVKAAVQAWR